MVVVVVVAYQPAGGPGLHIRKSVDALLHSHSVGTVSGTYYSPVANVVRYHQCLFVVQVEVGKDSPVLGEVSLRLLGPARLPVLLPVLH